jgi:hypothetical protein
MIDTKDITDRIESDFGDKASEVYKLFQEAFEKADYLNVNRTIRCVLFLANKDIEKLKKNIEAATYDPRDVMLWAEYTNHGQGEKIKRIRDFNKTFEQADKDVKE